MKHGGAVDYVSGFDSARGLFLGVSLVGLIGLIRSKV